VVEGPSRGVNRGLCIVEATVGDVSDELLAGGIDDRQQRAAAPSGPLTVNEHLIGLDDRLAGAGGAVDD
jgi:hypothetical protein